MRATATKSAACEGEPIGYVTSGSPSPYLKKNIALAYVPVDRIAPGTEMAVEVRGNLVKAKVVPTPFYRRKALKTVSGKACLTFAIQAYTSRWTKMKEEISRDGVSSNVPLHERT